VQFGAAELLGSFAKGQITVFIAFFCLYYGSMLL
jgi:hypothetical protein